jgi:hypothetical protein
MATNGGIRYRIGNQADRPISGHYSGSALKVLRRLLDGLDYTIRSSPDGLEVVVLGINSSSSATRPVQPERSPGADTGNNSGRRPSPASEDYRN